jgi:hypothetical protein
MPLTMLIAPALTIVAIVITFFLSDRSRWRKFILGIGIITAAISAFQSYNSRERVISLQRQVAELTGRRLTPESVKQITRDLKDFAGEHLTIVSYTGDPEAAQLGLQIKYALKDAGIIVADDLGAARASAGGVDFGIHISGPASANAFMAAIRKFLEERGKLDVSKTFVEPKVSVEGNLITIMIAFKPSEAQ